MPGRSKTRTPRKESMGKVNKHNIHKEWQQGKKRQYKEKHS